MKFRGYTWLLIPLIILLAQCEKERPRVAFSLSSNNVNLGQEVFFTNKSSEADTYKWYFGDGATSRDKNPTHIYESPGEYFISLIVEKGNQKGAAYASIIVGDGGGNGGGFNFIFTNQVFTPIDVEVNGDQKTVFPGEEVVFNFPTNPGFVSYYASTHGATSGGTSIGEFVEWWANSIDVAELPEKVINLITDSQLFFVYMQNNSAWELNPIEVYSPTDSYYYYEDIVIPNDNVLYQIGYYFSYTDINFDAYRSGTFDAGFTWKYGLEFTLPFENNQSVILHTDNAWEFFPLKTSERTRNDKDFSINKEPYGMKNNSFEKDGIRFDCGMVYQDK
jgi:plastocyanin